MKEGTANTPPRKEGSDILLFQGKPSGSGRKEGQLPVFLPYWFIPAFAAIMGRTQYSRDSGSDTISGKTDFSPDGICCFQNIQADLRSEGFHGNKGKISHTYGDMEIQSIDCLQAADSEIFKVKDCLFAAKVFFNSPSGKV